jgi:hypothetical protein
MQVNGSDAEKQERTAERLQKKYNAGAERGTVAYVTSAEKPLNRRETGGNDGKEG